MNRLLSVVFGRPLDPLFTHHSCSIRTCTIIPFVKSAYQSFLLLSSSIIKNHRVSNPVYSCLVSRLQIYTQLSRMAFLLLQPCVAGISVMLFLILLLNLANACHNGLHMLFQSRYNKESFTLQEKYKTLFETKASANSTELIKGATPRGDFLVHIKLT